MAHLQADGAAALTFWGFLFALIALNTVIGIGMAVAAGRFALKGARRLMGWARERRLLPGERQPASREAQDVVVEAVDEHDVAQTPSERRSYVRLDVDAGSTPDDITAVMRHYVGDRAVGDRACSVIDTLNSSDLRRQQLFSELDATFQQGSISWEKFAMPANAALDAVLRNSALLANRVQSFDSADYLRLSRLAASSLDDVGHQRLAVLRDALDAMDEIQTSNSALLLELDKLVSALSLLSGSVPSRESEYIVEELEKLVDDTQYYR